MENSMKLISVVVPCYNEFDNLQNVYDRVTAVFENFPYQLELLLVDDGSADKSREKYDELVALDERVRVVLMSRNFSGPEPILFAGLKTAKGDAVVLLDADLQDPPELIRDFAKKWEEGYSVVYGVRSKREGSLVRRIGYTCFYRIIRYLSFVDFPVDAGHFSLLDRRVVDIIASLSEKDVFVRGLRAWVGFKQIGVEYNRPDREFGETTFSFFRYVRTAKDAIVNFSYKPLEYVSSIAIGSATLTAIAGFFYLYIAFTKDAPRGFFTLLMAILILGTLQLVALGVIAEYLIRIFREVKARPPYVIDKILEKKKGDRE
ncbi:glycosyltransferase family 2 protein [Candidatus Babeliales bacterium]|nr:glycosyltransferase family 2 protein [Candidatus Babeliales bacterium]